MSMKPNIRKAIEKSIGTACISGLLVGSFLLSNPTFSQQAIARGSDKGPAIAANITSMKALQTGRIDGNDFIQAMYKAADSLENYSFQYTMRVYKNKKTVIEKGSFWYKKPGLIRLEEKGPYKKGAVAVLCKNGKVKAHLGGGLSLLVVELDPMSGLLRSANGHPMVQSDFRSLCQALKSYVEKNMKISVSNKPVVIDQSGNAFRILEIYKTDKLWKRVAVDPDSLMPKQWWDYEDGSLHSYATWDKLVTRANLPDTLFTVKGQPKKVDNLM